MRPKKVFARLLFALLASALIATAQSSRPGWGATPYHDASGSGVTFRVWAPDATSIYVPGQFNGWSTSTTPLGRETSNSVWNGVWSADVSTATNGQQYKYFINYSGGSVWKHDPCSRWVTSAGSASGANDIIYDPGAFNWNGDSLTPPALDDLCIYEMHPGTFYSNTVPSRLVAATNQLGYLKSLGINAVEVMPIAEFGNSGNSWGYDPAQLFAVDNSQYGGPDAFKTFVQACHRQGIAVLVDIVHNHYGPNLLDMWNFDGWAGNNTIGGGGIYFYESDTNLEITPWGYTRPNFSSNQVCSFIENNAIMWLSEYHVDGFRWDSAASMVAADDGTPITNGENLLTAVNEIIHTNYSGKISIAENVYDAYGFDSAWDIGYPYALTGILALTNDADRDMTMIATDILDNVSYWSTAGISRVVFLEDHDVVGDLNGGQRLVTAIDPVTPNSYRARKLSTLGAAVTFAAPGIPMIFQGQEMLENQAFDSGLDVDWSKTNTYSRIVRFYSDLIGVRRDLKGYTPGLEGDQCALLAADNVNKLIAFHRWKSSATNQDVIVVANFSSNVLSAYPLTFPFAGVWYTHLNGDSTNYSADYGNIGSASVTASGAPATGTLTIGPYSALILSPTPDAPPVAAVQATDSSAKITWPDAYSEWLLATNSSLNGANAWIPIPASQYQTNGSDVSIVVVPSGGNLFYRLEKL